MKCENIMEYICPRCGETFESGIDRFNHRLSDCNITESKVKVFNTHCKHCSEPVTGNPVIACPECGKHPGYQKTTGELND